MKVRCTNNVTKSKQKTRAKYNKMQICQSWSLASDEWQRNVKVAPSKHSELEMHPNQKDRIKELNIENEIPT